MSATIVGGIVGFIGAVLPEVFALIREWLAGKNGTVGTNGSVCADGEACGPSGAEFEAGSGPEQQAELSLTYRWLDIMRQGVRPVITYSFFAMFVYLKWVV